MAGDLSEADYPDGFSQDYLLRPLSLDPQAALAIGSASLIVLGMASFLVLRDQADRRSWLGAAIAVLGTSVIIGIGYRVITAGVGGANIGGGMAVLFGGPFVIALLAWTAAKVWSLRPGIERGMR